VFKRQPGPGPSPRGPGLFSRFRLSSTRAQLRPFAVRRQSPAAPDAVRRYACRKAANGRCDRALERRGGPVMPSDLELVDQYLATWDRFARGANELVPFLKKNKGAFEAALVRLLNGKDRGAAGRLVFYPVVQVGGSIPVDSDLGRAAAAMLGPDV